jgi:hypothetical protein
MLPRAAFSRALGRSARLSHPTLRNLHSRVPFSLSHWSEPAGNGLVPIVVEQTVCVHLSPCWLIPHTPFDSPRAREEVNDRMTFSLVSFESV